MSFLVLRHLYDGDVIDWPLPEAHRHRPLLNLLEAQGFVARWDRIWPLTDRYRLTDKGMQRVEAMYKPQGAEAMFRHLREQNVDPVRRRTILVQARLDPWIWPLLHDPYTHWSSWLEMHGAWHDFVWEDYLPINLARAAGAPGQGPKASTPAAKGPPAGGLAPGVLAAGAVAAGVLAAGAVAAGAVAAGAVAAGAMRGGQPRPPGAPGPAGAPPGQQRPPQGGQRPRSPGPRGYGPSPRAPIFSPGRGQVFHHHHHHPPYDPAYYAGQQGYPGHSEPGYPDPSYSDPSYFEPGYPEPVHSSGASDVVDLDPGGAGGDPGYGNDVS